MKKSYQTWLRQESESWVAQELITREQAESILAQYPEKQVMPSFQRTFSAVGAVLIGLGLLLVLAHNWDALSRSVRLTSVLVLLVASQIATFGAVKWQRLERYREGLSLVQSLMVGASILLMAETFPLGTDYTPLLGAWMVLILPIAILADTLLPIFLYMAVFIAWLIGAYQSWYVWLSWPLLFAVIPMQRRMEEHETSGRGLFAWVMVVVSAATFMLCFCSYFGDFAVQITALFFYTLSALGIRLDRTDEFWNKPLFSLGLIGSLICTFGLTFYNMWHRSAEVELGAPLMLFLAIWVLAMFFARQHSRMTKGDMLLRLSSLMPYVIGGTSLLWLLGLPDGVAVTVMNIYLLVIGFFLVGRGYGKRQVSTFNIGMLFISSLVIARFFDVDMSLMARGGLYILLGLIFTGVNYRLMKQKGGGRVDEDTVLSQTTGEPIADERTAAGADTAEVGEHDADNEAVVMAGKTDEPDDTRELDDK